MLPLLIICLWICIEYWDSNPRPLRCQSSALPTELSKPHESGRIRVSPLNVDVILGPRIVRWNQFCPQHSIAWIHETVAWSKNYHNLLNWVNLFTKPFIWEKYKFNALQHVVSFAVFSCRVEWPDIISYSWAPKRQNLNTNVIRMFKNKREKALICLKGMDKTRFPDFPKSHLMFWTTRFSWGMLYLQLQPKNRKFYEAFALSFCVPKLGTNRLFQRETCSRYEVKSDF